MCVCVRVVVASRARTAAYALGNLQRNQPGDALIHAGAVPLLPPLLHSAVRCCFFLHIVVFCDLTFQCCYGYTNGL